MEVDLTPDQSAFVQQAIEAGRLHRPEEAVREALSLWEERERRRAEILAAAGNGGNYYRYSSGHYSVRRSTGM